jgi:ribosomal protein S27AE
MVVSPNYQRRSGPPGLNFKCPQCGGGTGVTDSRPSGDAIRRRRKCYQCGHRLTTMEIPYDLFHDLNVEGLRQQVITDMNVMIASFGRLNRAIKAHAKLKELP